MSLVKSINASYIVPTQGNVIIATFNENVLEYVGQGIERLVVEEIAKRYVEENYVRIAALLDSQAIANLTIAEAGKAIAASISRQTQATQQRDNDQWRREMNRRD